MLCVILTCNRMVNIGRNWWWGLMILIPFVNFVTAYECCAYPAQYAMNEQLDKVGKIIRTIFVSFLIICVILTAALWLIPMVWG